MKTIQIDTSIELVWILANSEACLSSSQWIEPVHFLLGILKVIDKNFQQQMVENNFIVEISGTLIEISIFARMILGMQNDEIIAVRHSIRQSYKKYRNAKKVMTLHRSHGSRVLFNQAAKRALNASTDCLNLLDLLIVLLKNLHPRIQSILMNKNANNCLRLDEVSTN